MNVLEYMLGLVKNTSNPNGLDNKNYVPVVICRSIIPITDENIDAKFDAAISAGKKSMLGKYLGL